MLHTGATYDAIGERYSATRRPDPAHERAIMRALGDARSVLNVGAGTGSYEPTDRRVLAIEPSSVMIAQRASNAAPVLQAVAEHLPLPDDSFDASLAIFTVHHWRDLERGLREMRRVTRSTVVIMTADIDVWSQMWLLRDYLPEIAELDRERYAAPQDIVEALGGGQLLTVPTPADCADGFTPAFWKRPHAYLDAGTRAGMSSFTMLEPDLVQTRLDQLARDLERGAWHERNADLLDLEALDTGHRLIVTQVRLANDLKT